MIALDAPCACFPPLPYRSPGHRTLRMGYGPNPLRVPISPQRHRLAACVAHTIYSALYQTFGAGQAASIALCLTFSPTRQVALYPTSRRQTTRRVHMEEPYEGLTLARLSPIHSIGGIPSSARTSCSPNRRCWPQGCHPSLASTGRDLCPSTIARRWCCTRCSSTRVACCAATHAWAVQW